MFLLSSFSHLPPSALFVASCLLLFSPPPGFLVYLPPARSVGAEEVFGKLWHFWLAMEGEEEEAGFPGIGGGGGAGGIGQKSSELSAHQILVGGMFGQILRAELSSNPYPRVFRTNPPS